MLETELKLDLTDAAADALEASSILPTNPDTLQLHAVYYDTPDHALAQAGLSLRIRAAGDQRIQTVKADGAGSAGLFVRSEWEAPVTGATPILGDATPIKAMLGDRTSEVSQVFEVDVERKTWVVEQDQARIEVVLDRGQVLAGDSREAICEVELELKEGEPRALFALARQLDDIDAMRPGVLTKAERGYRLMKRKRTVFRAEPVALGRRMTAAQAFQHVARTCLRQYRLNEAVLLGMRDPGTLHQARVGLRRLRSAFSIFKPLFVADERASALRQELRWLAGVLGNARDLDVLLERAPTGRLHDQVQEAREAAYAQVESTLGSKRVRRMMLELIEWFAQGPWLAAAETQEWRSEPVRDFAEVVLGRFHRKVKKGGRELEALDDEVRHEVRKNAKKLRYASEFFVSLFDRKPERRRHKRFVEALEELQDQLGALNDLATAPEVIRKLGIEGDPEVGTLLGRAKRKSPIHAAAEAHDNFADAKRFWR